MHASRLALLPALAIFGLTGCIDFADFGESDRYKEDFHFSYPLNANGTVTLDNANGGVEISGWDQNTVEINGTKYASSKSMLDALKIDTTASPGAVHIRTVRPTEWHGGGGARYSIRVPRQAVLDGINTTNGGIRVDDLDGKARLKSTNGSIRVHKLHGELEARTTNGSIEANAVDGNATLRTSNGHIEAEATHGSFEAVTTNGSIKAALTDAATGWPVKAHSTNGHVEVRLKGAKLPEVRAETTNSSVSLHLPADANARVRASTSHSSIHTEFDVSMQEGIHSKTELLGNIGTGGPLMDLSSTNGAIRILKM